MRDYEICIWHDLFAEATDMSQKQKSYLNAVLIVLIVMVIVVGLWLPSSPRETPPVAEEPADIVQGRAGSRSDGHSVTQGELAEGETWVGGIKRPRTDVSPTKAVEKSEEAVAQTAEPGKPADPFDYGRTPHIKPDANPQVASVAQRIQNREVDPLAYGRAVSVAARPEPFDAERYRDDAAYRQAYLVNVEPGRVFVSAQPGEGVPIISRIGSYFKSVTQGQTVQLQVKAEPEMPVTFTSFDLGIFSNQLTTITVESDKSGIATAELVATPGTIEDVNILATSPVASGQIKFVVNIQLRKPTASRK
ncbi:hypothetical protein HED60_04480 [Planctomycetales bacterium ZRK34]|nr:hypothetical protein HED60_04480 [Planctomycetales bacterium ZRK34]